MIGSSDGWQAPQSATATPAWLWRGVARLVALSWRLRALLGKPVDPFRRQGGEGCLQPSDALRPLLAAATPRLALRAVDCSDRDALTRWQSAAREKLAALLRVEFGRPPAVCATAQQPPQRIGLDRAGNPIYLHRMTLPLSADRHLPIAMVATDGHAPRPVLLWQAGSGAGMHLAWGEMRQPADYQRLPVGPDIARQGAAQGWIVLCVEQFGFGERRERRFTPSSKANNTASVFAQATLLGRSLVGERVRDVMAAVDWLGAAMPGMDHAPCIDAERLLIAGHSSGGMTALFAAALDLRIAAALVSGSLGRVRDTITRRRADGGEGVVPGILDWFETEDVLAMVAPRPFATVSGVRDHIYGAALGDAVIAAARPAWRVDGSEDRILGLAGNGGHRIYSAQIWQAVDFLAGTWSAGYPRDTENA